MWRTVVGVLACIVVFCTTYALILPAITMEKNGCGKAEHMHGETCYTLVTTDGASTLACSSEQLGIHTHTDACRNAEGKFCCGYADFVVHAHDASCYDENESLWCALPEIKSHTHDDGCYGPEELPSVELTEGEEPIPAEPTELTAPMEREWICGEEEILLHEHSADCFEETGSLICGKQQVLAHVHTDGCFRNAGESVLSCELEEHTHSPACNVIGLLEALPTRQSVEEGMAAFAEDAYLLGLQGQVREAYEAYTALPEEEQAKVENIARLTELDWLRGLSLQASAPVTVTNEDKSSANVSPWADDTGNVRGRLQTTLLSINQGYTIRSVEFYRLDGITGSQATVAYADGGLSAANVGAKVFVYDLGTDGTGAPQACAVENPVRNEQTGLFTSFTFGIPGGGDGHIYAFLSASPATLEEMGIYLGAEQANGTWVAYDGATEQEANVKVTVTLPEDVTPPEGFGLFIRAINPGERYYPTDAAVTAKAGAFHEWQCYTIRWLKQDETGLHMLPLNENGAVTVSIAYLKDDAKLFGPAGARKLLIFNSNTDGSLVDRVADSVENVRVADDNYESFTFHAAQAGPYVFVSKKLEMGYISSLKIAEVIDGSAPFDQSDVPGNDSGTNNRIVRSYDTIQYNLAATFAARQEGVTANTVNMYFELTLRKSATAARFDVSKMLWLGENYSIEYLDNANNVIMVMAHNGEYYLPQRDENGAVIRDENGFAKADTTRDPVSMNAQVNGSTAGGNSYKVTSGGVAMQRLVGWTKLRANEGESILSGTQSFSTAVEVRNADNGETFAPGFRMWLEGNEENYGEEKASPDGGLEPAQPDRDNVVDVNDEKNGEYRVTVSAGTNFNVQLKKNTDMSYKNWFDFSTGQAVAEPTRSELVRLANLPENHGKSNPAEFTQDGVALSTQLQAQYANYRYGRMTCYGITLQLYNNTEDKDDLEAKGLRGLSLPVGDITFDLNFSASATAGDSPISSDEYTAILWDYNENVPAEYKYSHTYADPGRNTVTTPDNGLGNGGRNLYWDGETRSSYAKGGAPSNYIAYHRGCYYGGNWALTDGNGQKVGINTVASPTLVTGSGGGTTYHFSVSDYDFDFDHQHFPTRDAGNSGDIPGYDTYARCFSAGCVQVLSVFPMVQEVSEAEIFLNTTVSNLHLTTRAGQELTAQAGDDTRIGHEVNQDDNIRSDQIVLYAPGGLTKGNSFNGLHNGNPPKTTADGFLGTEYWTTSYDCSAFAGDDIWIISYGMIGSGGDYRTRSMNLLQLFDSKALRVRGEPDVAQNWDAAYDQKGNATFLYAADPDYPGGYDTNHKDANGQYDVLAYMNTVREEDLVYFTSLEELEANRYTCVGVLMELRNCDLLGGKYQYMRVPVQVNGDDSSLVGKTIATVNTFRVWSEDLGTITWANGQWNGTQNVLEGFPKPTNSYDSDSYSGELANGGKSPPNYVKTEYQDNLQVKGTHAGGTLAGNSLLILNYKAGINIGVDNKAATGMISYNLGNGETVVDYRLKNIRTEVSDLTGQTNRPVTDLTIHTVLDEGHPGSAQRISVSGGTYRIMGYGVDGYGNVADGETSIAIGTDPEHPTELEFVASDGKRYRIQVYAQLGPNSQSVKFVIRNAPVGVELPDITFQANFAAVTALHNNDTIKTTTYISGTSDKRAYDPTKGNTDNVTVGIVMLSGTNLTKHVDTHFTELDGVITYTVTYTNSGTEKINKIYFYDLIPHDQDIRGSEFTGKVVLREFDVTSSSKKSDTPAEDGTSTEDTLPPADAIVYYSTTEYWELYNTVKVFGGTILGDGTIDGMNAQNVEAMLEHGVDTSGKPLFQVLGRVSNGAFAYDSKFDRDKMSDAEKVELMSSVTGLYVKVENLQKGQTIDMEFKVQAQGNKAGDWYKNIANSWIADTKTGSLTSNKVETQTVSRTISGVVWFDRNLNGIRDGDEPLVEGVTATLFKKNDDGYEICTKDVTGKDITPCSTDEVKEEKDAAGNVTTKGKSAGAYVFENLADGYYIVAFSGAGLETFADVTAYQRNGQNDANTSDGKIVPQGNGQAFDPSAYVYYIHYSAGAPSVTLHSLAQMGTVSLVNGVEAYTNQDLGLIKATHELPQTGGAGTNLYTMGGMLSLSIGFLLLYSKKKRGKEDFTAF